MRIFVQQKMIRGELIQTIALQVLAPHRRRHCKLIILLSQQLFYRQQRRLFWILTKTIQLKFAYYLTAEVTGTYCTVWFKKKIKFEKSQNWSSFIKTFCVRRRSFERTWCCANLRKRKTKDDKLIYWSIMHSIYLLIYAKPEYSEAATRAVL